MIQLWTARMARPERNKFWINWRIGRFYLRVFGSTLIMPNSSRNKQLPHPQFVEIETVPVKQTFNIWQIFI